MTQSRKSPGEVGERWREYPGHLGAVGFELGHEGKVGAKKRALLHPGKENGESKGTEAGQEQKVLAGEEGAIESGLAWRLGWHGRGISKGRS